MQLNQINFLGFDHVKWRQATLLTEHKLKVSFPDISIINPFGFELLYSAKCAPKNVRKLYLYVNTNSKERPSAIGKKVLSAALASIKAIYPEIEAHFKAYIINKETFLLKKPGYKVIPSDKLLDIQVRSKSQHVLDDYAESILLVYQSILSRNGEVYNYEHSLVHRSRLFQLFLMQEAVYKSVLPLENHNFKKIIADVMPHIDNMIALFYDPNLNHLAITKKETIIIDTIVIPRCRSIANFLQSTLPQCKSIKKIYNNSFHNNTGHYYEISISKALYRIFCDRIRNAYLLFTE